MYTNQLIYVYTNQLVYVYTNQLIYSFYLTEGEEGGREAGGYADEDVEGDLVPPDLADVRQNLFMDSIGS